MVIPKGTHTPPKPRLVQTLNPILSRRSLCPTSMNALAASLVRGNNHLIMTILSGLGRWVYPNEALRSLGLRSEDPAKVGISNSSCLYSTGVDSDLVEGAVLINREGSVPEVPTDNVAGSGNYLAADSANERESASSSPTTSLGEASVEQVAVPVAEQSPDGDVSIPKLDAKASVSSSETVNESQPGVSPEPAVESSDPGIRSRGPEVDSPLNAADEDEGLTTDELKELAHWRKFPELDAMSALEAEYVVRDHMGGILYIDNRRDYFDLVRVYGSTTKEARLYKAPGYRRPRPLTGRRFATLAQLHHNSSKSGKSQNSPRLRFRNFTLWRALAPRWLRGRLPHLLTHVAGVGTVKSTTDPLQDERTLVLCLRGFSLMIRLLNWSPSTVGSIRYSLNKFLLIWRASGKAHAVACYKEAYRCFAKYLAGEPCNATLLPCAFGLRKGLPNLLDGTVRSAVRLGSVRGAIIAALLLSVFRLFLIPGKLKLETITAPYAGSYPLEDAAQELRLEVHEILAVMKAVGVKTFSLKGCSYRGLHATNKAGPNGPALYSSPLDALALRGSSLWSTYQTYCGMIGGQSLLSYLDVLMQSTLQFIGVFDSLSGLRGRIGSFDLGRVSKKLEAGGKLRAFAIPTYWVQVVLKPLHHALFDLLKTIPTDCTFAQTNGWVDAKDAPGIEYWSADLSAATDRFPVRLQEVILAAILLDGGEDIVQANAFASAWHRLVKGEVWKVQSSTEELRQTVPYDSSIEGVDHDSIRKSFDPTASLGSPEWGIGREIPLTFKYRENQYIEYAVGQPMGAYSSWAMFTVAHHIVVQLCARRAGIRDWWSQYRILGDDIVLWACPDTLKQDRAVVRNYYDYMNSIGVAVNPDKGLHSQTKTFEFAKVLVWRGIPITLLHWKEWSKVYSAAELFQFVATMQRRGIADFSSWNPRTLVFRLLESLPIDYYAARLFFEKKSTHAYEGLSRPIRELLTLVFSPCGISPLPPGLWYNLSTVVQTFNSLRTVRRLHSEATNVDSEEITAGGTIEAYTSSQHYYFLALYLLIHSCGTAGAAFGKGSWDPCRGVATLWRLLIGICPLGTDQSGLPTYHGLFLRRGIESYAQWQARWRNQIAPILSIWDGSISRTHPYLRKENDTLDRVAVDVRERAKYMQNEHFVNVLGRSFSVKRQVNNLLFLGSNYAEYFNVPRAAWLDWVGRQWGYYSIFDETFINGSFEERIGAIRDIASSMTLESPTSRMSYWKTTTHRMGSTILRAQKAIPGLISKIGNKSVPLAELPNLIMTSLVPQQITVEQMASGKRVVSQTVEIQDIDNLRDWNAVRRVLPNMGSFGFRRATISWWNKSVPPTGDMSIPKISPGFGISARPKPYCPLIY